MRTKTYSLVGIAADTNDIAALQAPTSGTALSLGTTDLSATPRFVTLTSAANLSAISFTIVGTNRWGDSLTEVLVGPNANTVQSLGVYKTIVSITPNGTSASTVSAGWPAGATSPWVVIGQNMGFDTPPIAFVSALTVAGTPAGNFEVTYSMFSSLTEPEITIDDRIDAVANTPSEAGGSGVRLVLTSVGTLNFNVRRNGGRGG